MLQNHSVGSFSFGLRGFGFQCFAFQMRFMLFEGVLLKTTVILRPGVGNHGSILLGFTSILLLPLDPVDPRGTSQRAPMIVKTQYTGPFFPENGYGNLCLTMDILRNPKNPRNPRNPRNPLNPRNPRIPWISIVNHGYPWLSLIHI